MGLENNLAQYNCNIDNNNLKNLCIQVINYYITKHKKELQSLYLTLNTDVTVVDCANESFEILFNIKNNKENVFKAIIHFKEYIPCYQVSIMNVTKDDINMKYSVSPIITTSSWDSIYKSIDYFVSLAKYM